MSKTKVFIIGASGFVGSAILKAFIEKSSDLEIFVTENQSAVAEYSGIKKIKGTMFDAAKIIEDIKPDIVIHAARISGKNYRLLGRRKAAFLGKRANSKICNTILKHNIKLLYISGSLMYGSHPGKKVTEDFPVNPISYAIEYSKAEGPFLKNYKKGNIIICRPGWIFGPDSWFKAFFENVINRKGYVPQYGDGESFMSIIHRTDLARLIKEYALNARYSNVYNLFSPIALRHKEFVNELAGFYKKDIKVIPKTQLIYDYGQVTCDALTCDIPLASNFTTIMDAFDFKYKTVKDLLASI